MEAVQGTRRQLGLPVLRRAGVHSRAGVRHRTVAQRLGPQMRARDDEAPEAPEALDDRLQGGRAQGPPQPPQASSHARRRAQARNTPTGGPQ
eukprot:3606455-Heterocapsa_arctica.AAC.1